MPQRVREIDVQTARRWLEAGEAEVVDVREPDEHRRERITGARLVPLSRFDPAAIQPAPGRKLILHCRSGGRSLDAAGRVTGAAGEVYSLAGGIEAWRAAGLPTEIDRSVNRISIMRQVQIVAGGCVLAGAALTHWVSPWFIGVPAFFGAGLLFAGLSGRCGMGAMLSVMPWNRAR
ncbi:MAG: rhodanese-like domain-containing protein [Phycisphaerales bacterium]